MDTLHPPSNTFICRILLLTDGDDESHLEREAEMKKTLLDTPSLLKRLWLADPLQKSSSFFMVASFSQLGVKKLANQYILPKAVNRRLYGSYTPLERGLLS